jgi:OmpA-OmpF porin, OOP family
MRKLRALSCAAFVASLLLPTTLHAAPDGFAINRFEPSERGSSWFVLESLDLRGHKRPAAGAVIDYQYRPLAIYEKDGSVRSAIVGHVLTTHLGGGIVMWERVRFSANLPVVLYTEGEKGSLGGVTYDPPQSSTTIGDARLAVDARGFGTNESPITGAFGVRLWLPTGSTSSYTGDGGVRVAPRAQIAGSVSMFTYSANLGIAFRTGTDTFGGSPVGHELVYAVAAGAKLSEGKVVVGPELFGSTGFKDAFKTRTTPLEILLGAHLALGHGLRVGTGIGSGLAPGFGAPQLRVLGNIEWFPEVASAEKTGPVTPEVKEDTDGDGIPDDDDACKYSAGMKTTDPKTNGCDDKDGDGIFDPFDNCPTAAGPVSNEPGRNGCPPPPPPPPGDRDGDFVPDPMDACPDVPGMQTEDPKTNGCPDPDADRDGIPADKDACPEAKGPASPDPKRNGCPPAYLYKNQIRILDPVRFKGEFSPEVDPADPTLQSVLTVIQTHPEIKTIRVEAHTDNRGNPKGNKKLTEDRAASIVKWLIQKGVPQGKLTSHGWGDERPIDGNDTEQGRRNNRRVEFYVEKEATEQPAQ